jgi:hypothetical protein
MEKPPRCGNTNLEAFFKKKFKSSDFKSKSIPSSSVVVKKLPNNPYLSSITGIYAFNLSKIKNFSLYFWKSTDDPSINDAVQSILNYFATSAPINWSSYYQSQTLNTFSQFTSFVNKTSSITTSYADSDVVCVLADSPNYFGACFGPEFIYLDPTFVDNKIVLFLSNTYATNETMKEGGGQYTTLVHEFGHGFGLAHPHDNVFGSTIMPGIGNIICEDGYCSGTSTRYPGIAGYINNSFFNSVMSYSDVDFFLPNTLDFTTSKIGYSQTLMPLDASALRWMYNLSSAGDAYVAKFGVKVINPAADQQRTQMIVGKNRELTFGSNCQDINFYFSNNFFKFNNLQPIRYQYNRIIEKPYTFYPQDLLSTVAILNFRNTGTSNIFIEKNALKTNLKVNCISNTVLNVYIIDLKNNYKINGTTYKDKKTGKKMTINNTSGATINVFFNK